jgi:REP element-mobilizing transposase RayT
MKKNLKFPPRILTVEQRVFGEEIIPKVCERGGWEHHEAAFGADHVHVVVTSKHEPQVIRRLLKRWAGEELSGRWKLQAGEGWWAEGGSIRWVGDEAYLRDAIQYVRRQRASGS